MNTGALCPLLARYNTIQVEILPEWDVSNAGWVEAQCFVTPSKSALTGVAVTNIVATLKRVFLGAAAIPGVS